MDGDNRVFSYSGILSTFVMIIVDATILQQCAECIINKNITGLRASLGVYLAVYGYQALQVRLHGAGMIHASSGKALN